MLEWFFYIPIATSQIHFASVSCNVHDFSGKGVGTGTRGRGAREKRVEGGW